jgi:Tol biopolymer transport system component
MRDKIKIVFIFILLCLSIVDLLAQRIPVLNQIDLPHNYYFRELYLPQLTSGPSSLAWMPDGQSLVFSMAGSLWIQNLDSHEAEQLTDGDGYDYQPDVSADGKKIIFVRYTGNATELMLLDLTTKQTRALTDNKAVNLEPRWSPDGSKVVFVSTQDSKHFLLHVASINGNQLNDIRCLTPDHQSTVKRYYYSAFDHAINPTWSKEGKEIYFISNREVAHGTGDLVKLSIESGTTTVIHREETSWRTKPDLSPDGTRLVYSSYAGRNWHQLWMLPAQGGYPMPLTYGEYDNTSPRWSPEGEKIAFISNREGNTSLWVVNALDGGQQHIIPETFQYLQPHSSLKLLIRNEAGKEVPARVSITDSRGKFYAPVNAWIHGDDARYPAVQSFESHYFHSDGSDEVYVPVGKLVMQVSHGPLYEIQKLEVNIDQENPNPLVINLKKIDLPADFGAWWGGDVHVHMNYTGQYQNQPGRLLQQAKAEDLNFVYNLIVNKEQRIPDIHYFSTTPDNVSDAETMLLHGQEFHTSFWGHLGLLSLKDHYILPDYVGYPQTAVESLFPHNAFIADRVHAQQGLVGYVHPFEQSEVFPDQSATLFNELPVDVALGKVDYYELIGFSDHKASEKVWYNLLNCGLKIPAAAGTDVMANYASLRGPIGLNRVYVHAEESLDAGVFETKLKAGQSFVTNGPIVGLTVKNAKAGASITINPKGESLSYSGFMRCNVPVDHIEVIWNGEVVATHKLRGPTKSADLNGTIKVKGTGWMLLRAWSDQGHPDLPDLYPYASTNPIYIQSTITNPQQKPAAEYFLKWISRIEGKINELNFRSGKERDAVSRDVQQAKSFYQNLTRVSDR